MGEVRVNRGGDDLTADLAEFLGSVTVSDDLSGTHEGEVQWIEEKDNIFPCTKGRENKQGCYVCRVTMNAPVVITGQFPVVFSSANSRLFSILWDHKAANHSAEQRTIKACPPIN